MLVEERGRVIFLEGLEFNPLDVVFAACGEWSHDQVERYLVLLCLRLHPNCTELNHFSNTIITGDKCHMVDVLGKVHMTMIVP